MLEKVQDLYIFPFASLLPVLPEQISPSTSAASVISSFSSTLGPLSSSVHMAKK